MIVLPFSSHHLPCKLSFTPQKKTLRSNGPYGAHLSLKPSPQAQSELEKNIPSDVPAADVHRSVILVLLYTMESIANLFPGRCSRNAFKSTQPLAQFEPKSHQVPACTPSRIHRWFGQNIRLHFSIWQLHNFHGKSVTQMRVEMVGESNRLWARLTDCGWITISNALDAHHYIDIKLYTHWRVPSETQSMALPPSSLVISVIFRVEEI